MKLIEFSSKFPSEQSCQEYFKQYRDKQGVICPKCGCTAHYFSNGKSPHYQCKACGRRQSLRAYTIMHHSHLSFQQWFLCMHLLTSTKTSLSASEIQRQLGRKHYRCVWEMVQKIRNAMHKQECEFKLTGDIEIDEAFFDIGEDKLCPVLVMAESKPVYKSKYTTKRIFGRLKMLTMMSKSKDSITFTALPHIDSNAILQGDGTASHNGLKKYVAEVKRHVMRNNDELNALLPWVHISIGHMKNQMRDVYHCIKRNYLQLYLSEFCWKKNRRTEDDLFPCLLDLAVRWRNDWWPIRKVDWSALAGLMTGKI